MDRQFIHSREVLKYPHSWGSCITSFARSVKGIVESGENRRVNIGISPLAGNAVVSIDPDRLLEDI
jgi:hypothetical protein